MFPCLIITLLECNKVTLWYAAASLQEYAKWFIRLMQAGLNWIHPIMLAATCKAWFHLANLSGLGDSPSNHQGGFEPPSGSSILSSLALLSAFSPAVSFNLLFATKPSTSQRMNSFSFMCLSGTVHHFPFLPSAHLSPVLWHRLKMVWSNTLAAVYLVGKTQRAIHIQYIWIYFR